MVKIPKGSEEEVAAVVLEDGVYVKYKRKDLKIISDKNKINQEKLILENPPTIFPGIGKNIKKITITSEKTGKSKTFDSIASAAKFYKSEKLLADSLGDRLKTKSKKPYKGYIIS